MGDKEGVDQMMAPPALNSALNSLCVVDLLWIYLVLLFGRLF
jgi:hypothetical protein